MRLSWSKKILIFFLIALVLAALFPLQRGIFLNFPGGYAQRPFIYLYGLEGLLAATGFRSTAASLLWMKSESYFTSHAWWKMVPIFDTVVRLDPHFLLAWDTYGWHCAWNLDAAAKELARKAPNREQRDYALKQADAWVTHGIKVYADGVQANPGKWELYFGLAWLYFDRLHLYQDAEIWFKKTIEFEEAPFYVHHMLVRVYEKTWQIDKALALLKKIVKRWPNDHIAKRDIEWWTLHKDDPKEKKRQEEREKLMRKRLQLRPYQESPYKVSPDLGRTIQ